MLGLLTNKEILDFFRESCAANEYAKEVLLTTDELRATYYLFVRQDDGVLQSIEYLPFRMLVVELHKLLSFGGADLYPFKTIAPTYGIDSYNITIIYNCVTGDRYFLTVLLHLDYHNGVSPRGCTARLSIKEDVLKFLNALRPGDRECIHDIVQEV